MENILKFLPADVKSMLNIIKNGGFSYCCSVFRRFSLLIHMVQLLMYGTGKMSYELAHQ